MTDPKNPFDFGTGSIDKDQWLKDIDNEQEGFVSQYANAANKHRTTLLRQAFQDLRNRIASGDMLSRTADGQYQFGSALISGDKHMQEAYQRALGFMGNLARRQINTPAPEPEKKSIGNIEERWIKSLNPSGNYNKTAYWKNQTDEERRNNLKTFLSNELTKVNNHEYNDFGGFNDEKTLTDRLNSVLTALESQKANDWTLQQLGFTKNWLQQPEEEKEEEAPKTEEDKLNEQLAEQQRQQKLDALKQQVQLGNNATVAAPIYFNLPKYSYNNALDKFIRESNDDSAVWYRNTRDAGKYAASNTGNTSPFDASTLTKAYNGAKKAFTDQERKSLDNYFSNLGVNYTSVYNNKDKQGEFLANLSRLFANNGSTYQDLIKKYLTPIGNGKFYINGSLNQGGHYSYFMPKSFNQGQAGIFDASLGRQKDQNEYLQGMYDELYSYKEGGVVKFQEGGISGDEYNKYIKPYAKVEAPKPKQAQPGEPVKSPFDGWSAGDYALLGSAAADVASMAASFVPGGQLASGLIGAGSTLTSSMVDFSRGNLKSGGLNLILGLGADAAGMLPVIGTATKTAKIAKTIGKLSKVLVPAFAISGATAAAQATSKLIKGEALTPQEWQDLAQGFQLIVSGGAKGIAGHKNAAFKRTQAEGVTHYDVNLKDGATTRITREEFEGAKRNDYKGTAEQNIFGKIKGKPVVTKEGLNNAHKKIVSESLNPLNSASTSQYNYMLGKAGDNGYQIKSWDTPEWAPLKSLQEKRLASIQEVKSQTPKRKRKGKSKAPKKEIGGILKALRNGGIIKAEDGWNTATQFKWGDGDFYKQQEEPAKTPVTGPTITPPMNDQPFIPDWYMQRFNNSQAIKNLPDLTKHTTNLKERQSGTNLDYAYFMNDAYANSGQANKQTDIQNYFNQSPNLKANNLQELINFYNNDIDTLYSPFNNGGFDYTKDDATNHNNLFKKVYGSRSDKTEGGQRWDIGWDANVGTLKTAGSATHARRPVNYEKSFEDELIENPEKAKQRVAEVNYNNIKGKVFVDESGKLHVLTPEQEKALEGKPKDDGGKKTDPFTSLAEKSTTFFTKIRNPFDPTLLLNSAKLATSLLGNADIYKNLLAEMPQAPLRDEIDRKLAIVGDQRSIDEARNKIGDLRHIQGLQQGSDQQVNFASALEAERVGRDIADNGFKNDALRQFDTAQKSWNLDNEDIMYNTQVGDANRRAIADRARMMAQIRAAYRNGNWNAIKSFVDDTSFWALKKYQREQDLADKAKEVQLGTLEQKVDDTLTADSKYKAILDKYNAGQAISDEERAYIRTKKAEVLKQIRGSYASDYYNLYHDPMFGGGFKTMMAKNGGSLEKEKLKARGKDNDRYVSMIKDLRKTSYRRRRR